MNITRLAIAAFAATVAYFVLGGLAFGIGPLRQEFANFPAVYRSAESMKSAAPAGNGGMLGAEFILAAPFSVVDPNRSGAVGRHCLGPPIGGVSGCALV